MPVHILLALCENERDLIYSILQRTKYQITLASSIESALFALESETHQLALIDEDFIAPGEGWTLARTIRQRFSPSFVILMLARGSYWQYDGSVRGEFLYKVNWIMHYPVSDEEILGNIERYLKTTHAPRNTLEALMYTKTEVPQIIIAAGNKPKRIEEYVGRVATGNQQVSIARMISPGGWLEPAQIPEFDEYSIVLHGELHARIDDGETIVLKAGQAISLKAGAKVQYSTPGPDGAEYISVCLPAFGPDTVHRQD